MTPPSQDGDRPFHRGPDDGQTPLDPDEAAGLLQRWITTRGELNEAEELNIQHASRWIRTQRRTGVPVATADYLRGLHRAMFGEVWEWAGTYRQSGKNIGVEAYRIAPELQVLFDDVDAWRQHDTYPLDERAVRLHHRLTWIHPFPNGNGRVSRLMADHYLIRNGADPFTWGATLPAADARTRYLAAIRLADGHDYSGLMAFVRT